MKLNNWAPFPGIVSVIKNKKIRLTVIPALLVLALLAPPLVNAQVFYQGPPAGFDFINAADADLDYYGLPPRPDPSETAAYNAWLRLVTTPQTRLENPTVEVTNLINGPALGSKMLEENSAANLTTTKTLNWSGVGVYPGGRGAFTANGSVIATEFVLPALGYDNCEYKPYWAAWWVGFDGLANADALQAGVYSINCSATYTLWYEWYNRGCTTSSASIPCYQTNISLPVSPGDFVFVEVWYTTSTPNGHAYFYNETIGKSFSVGFNEPKGISPFAGTSAEWVTTRPYFSSSTGTTWTNLANYIAQPSTDDYAWDHTHYYYPGAAPSGTTVYEFFMYCPPWNPSSACTSEEAISAPSGVTSMGTMWTFTTGPANQ